MSRTTSHEAHRFTKTTRWIAAGSLVGAAAAAVAVPATSGAATKSSTPAVVSSAKVAKFGSVLVNSQGLVLYTYTADKPGVATCTGACATFWPPLTVPAGTTKVAVGKGIKGKFSIIHTGALLQVAFNQHPLYTLQNEQAGQTSGQGVLKAWAVVPSNGKVLSPLATSISATKSKGKAKSSTSSTAPAPASAGF